MANNIWQALVLGTVTVDIVPTPDVPRTDNLEITVQVWSSRYCQRHVIDTRLNPQLSSSILEQCPPGLVINTRFHD